MNVESQSEIARVRDIKSEGGKGRDVICPETGHGHKRVAVYVEFNCA